MLYVQLDVNWPDSPKIIAAGMDGRGVHATALCLAKRLDRNGWVPGPVLRREGATDDLIGRLVDLGLFEEDGDAYRPSGWLEVNPSSDAIRQRRADNARMANHARWHSGPFADCEKCEQKRRSSDTDPTGSDDDPTGSLEGEGESEGEQQQPDGPCRTAEQRQRQINAAATIVARQRHGHRTDIGGGYMRGAANGIATDHYQLLHGLLVTNPDATLEDLVAAIERAERPGPSTNPLRPRPVAEVIPAEPPRWDEGKAAIAALRKRETA